QRYPYRLLICPGALATQTMRTPTAKLATYSSWREGGIEPLSVGQESELYDYRQADGRLEVGNQAGSSKLEDALRGRLEDLIRHELHEPLPEHLRAAAQRGFQDYLKTAVGAVRGATIARAHHNKVELEKVRSEFALNTKRRPLAVDARKRRQHRHHRLRHRRRHQHRRPKP
ncbi:MAG: hypothetical protein ACRDK2_00110, partial [Solirubrobacteraceae bacterium]